MTRHTCKARSFLLSPWLILVSALVILEFASSSSQAQVVTNITSSGLGTVVAPPNGPVTDITGGTRPDTAPGIPGPNLFHSFGEFHVGEGDIANFLNDSGLPTQNILSRVTGGNPSDIYGKIQATDFNDVNLYLLNPQGIVFGPNASIDIGGAFYASTAHRVTLEDGGVFSAIPGSEDALLTAASPEAFHFLGNTSPVLSPDTEAAILIQGLESIHGGEVSFIGRDAIANQLTVEGVKISSGTVQTSNGAVNILSIGGMQAVNVAHVSVERATLNANGINAQGDPTQDPPSMGDITISQRAMIDTSGTRGGTILIRGGDLMIADANLSANITDASIDDSMTIVGQGIDIDVTNDVLITDGARLETNVTETAPQGVKSGGIRVDASHVEILGDPEAAIDDRTGIRSDVVQSSQGGNSGGIEIMTESARVRGAVLQTSADGSADGGSIILNIKDDLILEESALLQSQTFGLGTAGDITIVIQEGQFSSRSGDITAQSVRGGGGGNINVTVGKDVVSGGGTTFDGGDILLDADGSIFTSSFLTDEEGRNIRIKARDLELRNGGNIDVQSIFSPVSDQLSGSLTIDLTGNLDMRGAGSGINEKSEITVISRGGTPSGGAMITAQEVNIGAFSTISTQSQNEGQGGDLTIRADSLRVTDGGSITSSSGNPFFIPGFFPPPVSIGDAGNIDIDVNGSLVVTNGGEILAGTLSSGNGGMIDLTADHVSLAGGSTISSISTSMEPGAGNAGHINVTANSAIQVSDSTVSTNAANALGGNVQLKAQDRVTFTNSNVTTQVLEGSSAAGMIDIDPDFVIIQNSQILSTAVFGDGGPITITANAAILVDPTSVLDASSQFGGDGTVDIQSPIQQLSGAIAPLPEEIAKVASLYAEACASQKGGQFSSLVKSSEGVLSPTSSRFLTSPLTFAIEDAPQPTPLHTKTTAVTQLTFNSQKLPDPITWKVETHTLPILTFQVCANPTP